MVLGSLLPGTPVGAAPSEQSEAQRQATRLKDAARAVGAAGAAVEERRRRSTPTPTTAVDQLRADLQVSHAEFAFREAIRDEQEAVYLLAGHPDLEGPVLGLLPRPDAVALGEVSAGVRAIWRLSGTRDLGQVRPRHSHRFNGSEPVAVLLEDYRSAATHEGVDWSYLAAINYIESDFGRVNGPSSAGAMGPMQFLPGTWRQYGGSGDIMSARDSIQAAAVFLARNGAPGDYDRAVLRYNHDQDYVAAVRSYAAAIRDDPLWLTRFYYWSTFG